MDENGFPTAEQMNCEHVDEQDLVPRYLAGQLDPAKAEAFEAHYFECERCWAEVRRATELRAAFASAPAEGTPAQTRGRRPAIWWRWTAPLTAAAAILLIAVWQFGPEPGALPDADVLRGVAAEIEVGVASEAEALTVVWTPVDEATIYLVRLHAADGTLLLEREVADTRVRVSRQDLPAGSGGELFWSVEALDALRQVVGRSSLVSAVPPAR